MTELLRNFWTRQSLPWIAATCQKDTLKAWLAERRTGIRNFGNLVAIVAIPKPTSGIRYSLISADRPYQRWPALAFTNCIYVKSLIFHLDVRVTNVDDGVRLFNN